MNLLLRNHNRPDSTQEIRVGGQLHGLRIKRVTLTKAELQRLFDMPNYHAYMIRQMVDEVAEKIPEAE